MKPPSFTAVFVIALIAGLLVFTMLQAQQGEFATARSFVFDEPLAAQPTAAGMAAPQQASAPTALVPDFSAGQHPADFAGLQQYTLDHLGYPERARSQAIEGTVRLLLEISAEGKITGTQVVQSLGYGCDEAALELVRNMPDWKPATNYGIPVKSKKLVDFSFGLER